MQKTVTLAASDIKPSFTLYCAWAYYPRPRYMIVHGLETPLPHQSWGAVNDLHCALADELISNGPAKNVPPCANVVVHEGAAVTSAGSQLRQPNGN